MIPPPTSFTNMLRITRHRDRSFRFNVSDFGGFPGIAGHAPGIRGHVPPESHLTRWNSLTFYGITAPFCPAGGTNAHNKDSNASIHRDYASQVRGETQ
jgi:hypothetical protein